MFHDERVFTKLDLNANRKITTSDPNSNLICKGHGTVEIIINNQTFVLKDCLYVPSLTKNLVSLLDLCYEPITITRDNSLFHLSQNNQTILSGKLINKLMIVKFNLPTSFLAEHIHNVPWHHRLGHPGNNVLKSLGLQPLTDKCDICVKGKMMTLPFKSHFSKTFKPLDCVHLVIVGPISPPSILGHRYFLTMVDQFTSFKITRFLKNKSDVYEEFVHQQNLIENLHERKIKKIVTDGGSEFCNQRFKDLANERGFQHVVSPPYTPVHNGVVE
ncbi:hypothetical protein O181_119899 [Austropuccinia psidii MF-1]|uniref:Integrase catalytic domain-containing protein n=1 Tax=Austropuccinia psidii MF-1 TaxID=1389203 RepID=A0A9Q3KFL9_9BASI|nr:hypothetical protein [Austropuccinia psidii MF-1]